MSNRGAVPAAAWAEQQVAAVRDDPAGRITLMERCYYGPYGKAPRHLPFRRAALSFMRWQLQRGVLQPAFSDRPGSPWWRAVNERILRDGCESVGLSGNLPGPASSPTVSYWMSFAEYPTARAWYRAHMPHLKRLPSEYIRSNVWVTTQPIEEPERPEDLLATCEWIGWDRIMFSTDYPHWDQDDPRYAFKAPLTEQQKRMVFRENALAFYGLE